MVCGSRLTARLKIREFMGIAEEEDRGIVSDQVPIAFFSVELHGKAADVAFRIRRAVFPGNGREAYKCFSFLAYRGKYLGLGVSGNVVG